jgi:2'-5' RNA ligase
MVRLGEDLRRRYGLKSRATPADRLHLSLNLVGNFRGPPPRQVIEKAVSLADKVAMPAFKVALNRVECWEGDPHLLVLSGDGGTIGPEPLHAAIHKALAAGTMAPRRQPEFWPHVTLLRDALQVPRSGVEPVSWRARDFVLLDSQGGEARPGVLGRWPLGGA